MMGCTGSGAPMSIARRRLQAVVAVPPFRACFGAMASPAPSSSPPPSPPAPPLPLALLPPCRTATVMPDLPLTSRTASRISHAKSTPARLLSLSPCGWLVCESLSPRVPPACTTATAVWCDRNFAPMVDAAAWPLLQSLPPSPRRHCASCCQSPFFCACGCAMGAHLRQIPLPSFSSYKQHPGPTLVQHSVHMTSRPGRRLHPPGIHRHLHRGRVPCFVCCVPLALPPPC